MRVLISTTLLALALVAPAVLAAAPADRGPGDTGAYLVGFHTLPSERATYAGERVERVDTELAFFVVEPRDPRSFETRALRDPNVRYLERDSTDWQPFLTPNDPLHTHAALWGTHRVGAPAAWDTTLGSTAVKIAVVDSGLNKGHEEFAGQARILQGFDFRNGDNDPEDTKSCDFHGTHVTGTLGATTHNGKGIAGLSQSSILPVKIFDKGFFGCGTTTTAIVDALKYAGDQGAHLSQNSWGGGGSSTAINDAIAYAHAKGTTHVAAAGNSGPCTNCVSQPWKDNAARTIVVSSLTDGDTFSRFSSQGPEVTVIAPGEYVGSSTSGTSSYHAYSGTSMAAPHVSGSLALHLAVHGNVGFTALRDALTGTAEDLGMSSDRQGAGLVRVDRMVGGGTTPPPPPENAAPTASFTYSCTDLACSFTDTSTDADGSVVGWSWTFGDGATSTDQHPGHTFAEAGTYTVSLTVTDDDGATHTASESVTVTSGDAPGGIGLTVTGYKVKGVKHGDLAWSGATSTSVDVYRDGAKVATVGNSGAYTDVTGQKGGGSTTWKVCEAGTATCSNDATWNW